MIRTRRKIIISAQAHDAAGRPMQCIYYCCYCWCFKYKQLTHDSNRSEFYCVRRCCTICNMMVFVCCNFLMQSKLKLTLLLCNGKFYSSPVRSMLVSWIGLPWIFHGTVWCNENSSVSNAIFFFFLFRCILNIFLMKPFYGLNFCSLFIKFLWISTKFILNRNLHFSEKWNGLDCRKCSHVCIQNCKKHTNCNLKCRFFIYSKIKEKQS